MADIYEEMINDYTAQKNKTQEEINNLATEKRNVLDTYEKQYNQQLTDYENLMNQQQQNIDTWANTQKETQQKQTDYELGLIEQAQKETEKQTNTERGNAYIDYQKGLNQFGGSAEILASQGLSGTGFAKNQEIAMNITYQNRLAAANTALQKANTEYNNQMQQALLNNDAKLAEIALQQLEKSYALALEGFQYKTTLQNNRLTYIQNINDTYFSKTNTLQSRLDSYQDKINSAKNAQEQARIAEEQAKAARYYSSSSGSFKSSGSSSSKSFSETSASSGLDISNVPKMALQAAGISKYGTIGNTFGKGVVNGGKLDNQYIYRKGNNFYINYNGEMIDVTSQVNKTRKVTDARQLETMTFL